jgi:VCBS repeat-containing protein
MATTISPSTKTTADSAKTFSNKGTVAQVIGEVKVTTASGETHILQVGDKINVGDTIQTGADGAVAITFDNGANINLGHADNLTFTAQMLADLLKPANSAVDDAARIQELIAQGADPTQVAAASAAGAGGGEDGGHSFVDLDTPNSRVAINSNVPTDGITVGFQSPTLEPPNFVPEPVNAPPTAVDDISNLVNGIGSTDDGLTVKEDSVLQIPAARLLGNDTDPDGDPLVIIGITPTSNGTVVLNPDGSLTYTPNPNFNGTDSFTYTVSDGNGGTSTATVIIGVIPVGEPLITVSDENGITPGDNTIVENSGLPVTGSFTVQADEGVSSISINGLAVTLAQLTALGTTPVSIGTEFGTLTLTNYNPATGAVTYSYAVEAGGQDHTAGDNSVHDVFALTLTDSIGQTNAATLDVMITDTVPLAINDGPFAVAEDAESFVSGNVLTNDVSGADTPKSFVSWSAADAATVAALNGYGSLTQNANGTWSFTLNNALASTQALSATDHPSFTLHYTMQDADGDLSSAELTITLNGSDDSASVTSSTEGPDVIVYEHGLTSGLDTSETATGSFSFSATDGLNNIVVGGVSFTLAQLQSASALTPLTVNTAEGTLLITGFAGNNFGGSVDYSYTVLAPINNVGGAANESFSDTVAITVNGIGGTTANGTLNMTIIDDHPVAVNDGPYSLTEDSFGGEESEGSNVVAGNVLINDVANADSPKSFVEWAATDATTVATLNTYGSLVQGTDGSWSFTLNNGLLTTQALSALDHPSFTLHYTMQDSDGDLSSAELTITLNGTNDRPEIHFVQGSGSVVLSEEGLSNALIDDVLLNDPSDLSTDPSDAAGNPKTASGSFNVSDVDVGDTLTVTLDLSTLPILTSNGATVNWALSGDGHTATAYLGSDPAANTVLTVVLTQQGSSNIWTYDVELFKPVDHPFNSYEDVLNLNLSINVSDGIATSTGNLSIAIEDDMPVAAPPQSIDLDLPSPIATNLVLTLDVSGSMDSDSGDGVHTRLELAKLALTQLITSTIA